MVVGEDGLVGLVSSVKDDLFNLFRGSIYWFGLSHGIKQSPSVSLIMLRVG